jgi:hypothetical protein
MIQKLLAHLIAVTVSLNVYGGEIYKWTDKEGKVHFSDSVPDPYKHKAIAVDLRQATVTTADSEAAKDRLEREKAKAAEYQSARDQNNKTANVSTSMPNKNLTSDKKDTCEEQWKKYDESYACFNPYRIRQGIVKPEAFQHCTVMEQPKCSMPSNTAISPNY